MVMPCGPVRHSATDPQHKKGKIIMTQKSIFAALVLTIVIAWSGFARADSVIVKNRSGEEVEVRSFNGDDTICFANYGDWYVKSGEDQVISCNFGGNVS